MNKAKQASIHIRCDQKLADEFKKAVEQNGYTKSLVIRELMQKYINNSKKHNLPTQQATVRPAILKNETDKPLRKMSSDDLLKLAIRMAEKHI